MYCQIGNETFSYQGQIYFEFRPNDEQFELLVVSSILFDISNNRNVIEVLNMKYERTIPVF